MNKRLLLSIASMCLTMPMIQGCGTVAATGDAAQSVVHHTVAAKHHYASVDVYRSAPDMWRGVLDGIDHYKRSEIIKQDASSYSLQVKREGELVYLEIAPRSAAHCTITIASAETQTGASQTSKVLQVLTEVCDYSNIPYTIMKEGTDYKAPQMFFQKMKDKWGTE